MATFSADANETVPVFDGVFPTGIPARAAAQIATDATDQMLSGNDMVLRTRKGAIVWSDTKR